MSSRVPALVAAQAVALSARTDGLTMHAVDDMRTKAEELLARDDPMRGAMLAFATQYEALRRDPYALRLLGEALERALAEALALGPAPARPRRDIDD